MTDETLSERQEQYDRSIGLFYSIMDDIMEPDFHKPGTNYLTCIVNMGFHLRCAKQTGLPMRKHYKKFRKVKRMLKRRGVGPVEINADRISSVAVLDSIANAR